MSKHPLSFCLLFFLAFTRLPALARAADFQCEVMSLEGSASVTNAKVSHRPLKEGDVLDIGDTVEVDAQSLVDLGYDKNWQNVTRLDEKTKVEIKSLFPTTLKMDRGGVYAQLRELPKESTFEIQTPTAIAAVRGTEYRTAHDDNGTQVYNFSDSQVFVFGQNEDGNLNETPTVVDKAQMTEIDMPGASPAAPRPMFEAERQKGRQIGERIQKRVQENIRSGRVGKIRDLGTIDKIHRQRLEAARTGQGRLASMEHEKNKEDKIKEAMGREDKMFKAMRGSSESGVSRPSPAPRDRQTVLNQNVARGPQAQGKPLQDNGNQSQNMENQPQDPGGRPSQTDNRSQNAPSQAPSKGNKPPIVEHRSQNAGGQPQGSGKQPARKPAVPSRPRR
ncbi:MAG: hypothetical protein COT00_03220 [Candidatus Omnitrophica bacterium CG07_land_8_20_14_0_80_50_8]|nr:MAG: hypothetical protein AUJ71_04100 [Candidatus Omnitrophica bacterium CG1_02_49_16]PIU40144.1 MAG: hypothetical protein COT00_03220 [Candidatus Omnitrophica bacterium CG07_land_8_20_14_0_80_50_8]